MHTLLKVSVAEQTVTDTHTHTHKCMCCRAHYIDTHMKVYVLYVLGSDEDSSGNV